MPWRVRARQLADVLGPHAPSSLRSDSPHLPLPHGSTVTVEPGGQLGISSPPRPSLPELIATVDGDTAAVTDLLDPAGLVLSDRACDPLRPSRRLLDSPRYAAMETTRCTHTAISRCATSTPSPPGNGPVPVAVVAALLADPATTC